MESGTTRSGRIRRAVLNWKVMEVLGVGWDGADI